MPSRPEGCGRLDQNDQSHPNPDRMARLGHRSTFPVIATDRMKEIRVATGQPYHRAGVQWGTMREVTGRVGLEPLEMPRGGVTRGGKAVTIIIVPRDLMRHASLSPRVRGGAGWRGKLGR